MAKILVVDDDLPLADVIAFSFRRAGFLVVLAHDGRMALELFYKELPDLIVLDWSLPKMDGIEVCQLVRAVSEVPIIMLTVHNADDDVVAALEAGVDDYVTKPFSPRQLVARVKSILRRKTREIETTLSAGQLSLDIDLHEVSFDENYAIHLTPLETRLLQTLIQNANHVMTTENLIVRVWGLEGATRDMLKQLIYRLRKKTQILLGDNTLIMTIPNVGYILNTPPESK